MKHNTLWFVYIILTSDNCFYTGITTDIKRRWRQHSGAAGGARFFRGRKPVSLLYLEEKVNRSLASRREVAIKKLTRRQKEQLISSETNALQALSAYWDKSLESRETVNINV